MLETIFTAFIDFSGGYVNNIGRGLLLGLLFVILYTGMWVVAALWNFAWAWIDDAPRKRYNCFSGFIAKITNHRWEGGTWAWRTGGGTPTDIIHFFPMLAILIGPVAIITLLTFYSFFLTVVLCVGAAYGTRFVRRMKKAFDKHVHDKDAHKKGD